MIKKPTLYYLFSKCSFFLFCLYLLAVPLEKRHFFEIPMVRLISGFNEWISVSLYASDIILLLLLLSLIAQFCVKKIQKIASSTKTDTILLLASITLVALSLASALLPDVYVKALVYYRTAVIATALILFFYVSTLSSTLKLSITFGVFLLSGTFQSIVALLQFTLQHSLGLKFLGEIDTSPFILNVPKIVVDNSRVIRSVGTFPHANVLGMFLAIAVICGIFLLIVLHIQRKTAQSFAASLFSTKKHTLSVRITKNVTTFLFFGVYLCTLLCVIGVLLSFSRTAIATLIIALAILTIYTLLKYVKKRASGILLLKPLSTVLAAMIIFALIFIPFYTSRMTVSDVDGDMSVTARQFLTDVSLDMISYSPFVGVGMGNYIYTMSIYYFGMEDYIYQPVHNLYLLITAEIGFMGLALFLVILLRAVKAIHLNVSQHKKISLKTLFAICLFVMLIFAGLFDHYFWSIRQGVMLFWITMGLALALTSANNIKKTHNTKTVTYQ